MIFGGQTGEAGCLSLTSVTFHNNITYIGNWAFMNCKNLVIPDLSLPNLLELKGAAFIYTKIQQISNLGSIIAIEGDTFRNCTSLTRVVIPSTLQSCGTSCFYGCTALQRVDITDLDAWMDITFTDGDSNPLKNAHNLYLNNVLVTSVDFTGKTGVKNYVFIAATCLTSVTLPNTITAIGNYAFANCTNLVISDLNLPNLTTLGSYALRDTKVKAVSNLGNITSINENTFRGCSSLTSVILPQTCTIIRGGAFRDDSSLTSINLNDITNIGNSAFQ